MWEGVDVVMRALMSSDVWFHLHMGCGVTLRGLPIISNLANPGTDFQSLRT